MNRPRRPGFLERVATPHAGRLSNTAFVPLGPRTRTFLIAFFLMAQVVSPALAYTLHGGDDPYPVATFALNLVYTGLLIAPLALPMRVGVLHPLVFPLLFTALKSFIKDPYFLLSPFNFLFSDYQLIPQHEALLNYGLNDLSLVHLKVVALDIVGLVAYYIGYSWFRVSIKRRQPRRYVLVATPLFIVIGAALIGAGFFLYSRGGISEHMTSLAFGRFQALGTVGYLLVAFDIASVAVFLWYAMRPAALRSPWFLAILVPVTLLPFILTGSRSGIFLFLIEMGILWLMHKRRLPIGALVALLLLVPVGLLAMGVMLDLRTSAWSSGQTEFSSMTAVDVQGSMERAQLEIRDRDMMDGETGVVAEGHHVTGYQWGQTYIGALAFWVPRALWPGKPRAAGALYVNKILRPGAEFGVPIGPVAEAYWNFGLPGIFLIMGLWGCFHRWLADYYAINGDNPFFRVFYLITVTIGAPGSDNIPPYLQQCVLLLILFIVLRVFGQAQVVRPAPQGAWRPAASMRVADRRLGPS